jgi:hypothetical protein
MVVCTAFIPEYNVPPPGSDSNIRGFKLTNILYLACLQSKNLQGFSLESRSQPFYYKIIVLSVVP